MKSELINQVLEMKKKKFFEVVQRICLNRDLPIPILNFSGCDGETGNQLAHYHPDHNMICISERQLTMLNFEDVENVATHEVSHILIQDHSPNFDQENELNAIANWRPPTGVAWIR